MEGLVKEGALGSILIRSRMISEEDIGAALDEQRKSGCRFGEALVKLGVVSKEDIDWALSSQLNIPYVRLKPEMIDRDAVNKVPASLARKFNLIPIFRTAEEISIAIADPLDRDAIEAVEQVAGCRATVSIPVMRELREMLDLFYGPADDVEIFGFSTSLFPPQTVDTINRDLSGEWFLDFLFQQIIRERLTSISLQPVGDNVVVVARQGGKAREIGRLESDHYPALMVLLRKNARIRGELTARGIMDYWYNGEKIAFQVLILKGQGGDLVTLKLHVPFSFPSGLEELELDREGFCAFRELASLSRGVVLLSAAVSDDCLRLIDLFLDECDTADKTVIILGERAGNGRKKFPRIPLPQLINGELDSLVASVLDHDPDILVFDDVADGRPLSVAARAAAQGKLVLCGVDGRNQFGVINFILGFQGNLPLMAQIRGVVSVHAELNPCPSCTGGQESGCVQCGYTGFIGRRYRPQVIPFTQDLLDVFNSAAKPDEVMEYLKGKGFALSQDFSDKNRE